MFSNLGPLFKTVFRTTEETDTRQAIKHEEKDQSRKRKDDEQDHKASPDLWEDKSSVSVDALQAFLISFIKGETFQKTNKNNLSKNNISGEKHPKKNLIQKQNNLKETAASRAAHAYQTTSKKNHEQSTYIKELNSDNEFIADADLIESEEARQIYKLITDLNILKNNGINEISIDPANSFIESLKNAVERQKTAFNK